MTGIAVYSTFVRIIITTTETKRKSQKLSPKLPEAFYCPVNYLFKTAAGEMVMIMDKAFPCLSLEV